MSSKSLSLHNPFTTSLEKIASNLGRAKAAPLLEREDFFKRVIESLSEAVLITDKEGRVQYANHRVERMFGYQPDELTGKICYETLIPKKDWPQTKERLKRRSDGEPAEYETEIVEKNGAPHWVHVKGLSFRDGDGKVQGSILIFNCLEEIKDLQFENDYLKTQLSGDYRNIIGSSSALKKVLHQIELVATADAAVLVNGESGTGKELVARAIHERSSRKAKPLVKVNCGAIPENLFESEFFGHARGSFTGALKDKIGRFELAEGGTIFLDEIGELPMSLQAKLLRVLQEKEFERVGEGITRKVDARIVAATNRDLKKEVEAGRFRQDLFYRLSVFPIEVPPLRERREDIPALAMHFATTASERMNKAVPRIPREHLAALSAYEWPGNVRELQNVIERAVILSQNGTLHFDLPSIGAKASKPSENTANELPPLPHTREALKELERQSILNALKETGGKVSGNGGAAELLHMKPTTLASRIKALGLDRRAVV